MTHVKDEKTTVVYIPISHSPPRADQIGYKIPDGVKKLSGLDSAPQWIILSECNIDTWPDGLNNLPRQQGRFHYGQMTPNAFLKIRDDFTKYYREKKVALIWRR